MTTGLSGLRALSVISLGGGMTGGEDLVHAGPGGRRTLFVAAGHARRLRSR